MPPQIRPLERVPRGVVIGGTEDQLTSIVLSVLLRAARFMVLMQFVSLPVTAKPPGVG